MARSIGFRLVLALGIPAILWSMASLLAAPEKPDSAWTPLPRKTWESSKIQGAPEPPSPYQTQQVFKNAKFDSATDLEISPLNDRWFVTQHHGKVWTFANQPDGGPTELFHDFANEGNAKQQRWIWSMTFHPKFKDNGFIYICYHESNPQPPRVRILRYTLDVKNGKTPTKLDAKSAFLIAEWGAGEDHWGGCLKFGKDGYLYFSAGDGSGYADGTQSGQDLSDWNAAIMRIDVDKRDRFIGYGVPEDNPFINTPGAKPEIWAYGTRNIWKMSFDRETGDLWGGDVGQDLWDPIYFVVKGGNYGWSIKEGSHDFRPERKVGPTPILPPVVEHDHSEARSITGGFVYRGKKYPDLFGAYIYGDYDTGKIWGVKYDSAAKKVTWHKELVDTSLRIVGFAEDNSGELFILDHPGSIHELIPTPKVDPSKPVVQFPRKLSETGLFASTKDYQFAEGIVPYFVNSQLWSDHAIKDRWIAIPGKEKIRYEGSESWNFPEQTVLVKTFALEQEVGNPASKRRLETRIMHLEQNHWRGYTYIWNDAQTDAELAPKEGVNRKFVVKDAAAPNSTREQTWRFPSRAECTICHTMPARFVLGLSTAETNRDVETPHGKMNQLEYFDRLGLFNRKLADAHPNAKQMTGGCDVKKLAKLADPWDETQSLEARAKSYLHMNCAHCHRKWGGGNATFWLTWYTPMNEMNLLDVKPQHGNLDIADACLLQPGHPEKSLLLSRMSRLDEKRMPRAGSNVVDEKGVKLIREWIEKMK
jgi:uncharacterized repeat protein (TIGR03806 family)